MRTGSQLGEQDRRSGTSLVEVMVAVVLLAVLAIGGAASLHLARSQMVSQRNHRMALEVAGGRLEALRAAAYTQVTPLVQNYVANFVDLMTGAWRVSAADPGETVSIGGRARPMVTTVTYVDADAGSASYDLLRFRVSVQYGTRTQDVVRLETMRSR